MNQDHYISLIIQQLSGSLNDAQTAELNKWLSESLENKAIKNKLIDSWNKADNYKKDIDVDESGAWNNITSKLRNGSRVIDIQPKVSIPLWRKALMIAASLALFITCSWLFFSPDKNPTIMYATNANETLDITLPDGSIVNLNKNSHLTYSDTKERRIATLDGEALFEVSHDESHPFIVQSHQTTTSVLGTKFNVSVRNKEDISVSLFEGKVSFDAGNQSTVILAPGEMISYGSTSNKVVKTVLSNENAMAWKTKELNFRNDNLKLVVNTIEKYFDKNIELDLNDNACLFTGSFKNPDYQKVIEVLEYTYDLGFESNSQSDKITIRNCK